jgi:hypothetical protein
VEATYGQAYLAVRFETSTRRQETEVGRLERVVCGQRYSSVVKTIGVWTGTGRAEQCEVPFMEIRVGDRGGVEGGIWIGCSRAELGGLFEQSPESS